MHSFSTKFPFDCSFFFVCLFVSFVLQFGGSELTLKKTNLAKDAKIEKFHHTEAER